MGNEDSNIREIVNPLQAKLNQKLEFKINFNKSVDKLLR